MTLVIDQVIFILGILSACNLAVMVMFVLWARYKILPRYSISTIPLSIVVPAHNEETSINACLESIAAASEGRTNIEVVCVDNGSTDTTGRIMNDFITKYKNKITGKYIYIKQVGKVRTLNAGVDATRHDLILTLDADTIIDALFLERITAPFSDSKIGYAFATLAINPVHQHNWITHYQALEYSFINLLLRSSTLLFGYPVWFCGAVVCYRRKALVEAGGFSADTLTEDVDLSYELYQKGYKAAFLHNVVSYTEPMQTIPALASQRMRWNYGAMQNAIKHWRVFNIKALILCYLLFSTTLWLFNSLVMLPTFLITLASLTWEGSAKGIYYFLMSGTMTGPIRTLLTLGTVPGNRVYDLIGVLLLVLCSLSVLSTKRNWRWQTIAVLFTYFTYICFLQACCILSFVKYRGKLSIAFVSDES